jgi:hypothetical protein
MLKNLSKKLFFTSIMEYMTQRQLFIDEFCFIATVSLKNSFFSRLYYCFRKMEGSVDWVSQLIFGAVHLD